MSPQKRNVAELPRHEADDRELMSELTEWANQQRLKASRGEPHEVPRFIWIVLSGTEESMFKGVPPIPGKSDEGRPLGQCPYCKGDPQSLPVACDSCVRGKVHAWYWASGGESRLTPIQRVFNALWDGLQAAAKPLGVSSKDIQPFDGFQVNQSQIGQADYSDAIIRTKHEDGSPGYPQLQYYPEWDLST